MPSSSFILVPSYNLALAVGFLSSSLHRKGVNSPQSGLRMASTSVKTLAAALSLASVALAQSVNETVWSSFSYVLYGERTPEGGVIQPSLTPLGAQQLYSQGSLFRARYLSNSNLSDEDNSITTNSPIAGIEQQALDSSQVSVLSTTDSYVVGGALAFLQGLYPPVTNTFAYNNGGTNASTLANGSSINYPLGGYQYPNIQTISSTDPESVWQVSHVLMILGNVLIKSS